MLSLVRSGNYRLVETKANLRVLYLDTVPYVWAEGDNYDQLQLSQPYHHKTAFMLACGLYYLYCIKDEPLYSDTWHLELQLTDNSWQGYLLHDNLPTTPDHPAPIAPTREIITATFSLLEAQPLRRR